MDHKTLLAALVLTAATSGALAAPAVPKFLMLDQSSETLIDKATTAAVWKERLPDAEARRLAKLYPVGKWGFLSQVEGGFNEAKTCVVTARVMLLPRSGKTLVVKPEKTATAFDAQPGLNQQQCKDLARTKLNDAATAVLSSVMAAK